jgi:sodium transport system permease protein
MIFIALVLPLMVFPALILILRSVDERESQRLREAVYRYALASDAQDLATRVDEALELTPAQADGDPAPVRFERVRTTAPDSLLQAGGLEIVVDWPSEEPAEAESDGEAPEPADIALRYRAESDLSRAGASALAARLVDLGAAERDSAFQAAGSPNLPELLLQIEIRNVATPEREGGAALGLALTPFVLLLLLTGGSIAAVDTLSGERERGTLETLLTTGLRRREIVRAKLLAIAALGLVVVATNAANLLLYLGMGVLELPDELALALAPVDALLVVVLLLPLTVLVASALLLLSGRVDGYKDFQIVFFPVLLAFVALAVAGALPGMELQSAIALVPVAGIGVAVREVLVGTRTWIFLFLAWSSTAGAAWLTLQSAEHALSAERLLGGSGTTEAEVRGGPELFPRRVLWWFAGTWSLFFTASLWLGEALGVRGQAVVNLVVIFGGATWLMVRRYRLNPVRALYLRAPSVRSWVAAIVGAPAGYVVGVGMAAFLDRYVIPMPDSMMEAFQNVLLPESVSLWQLLFFLAVLPAVFEELAFRGVLLHGLRQRLGPVAACLAVGAIFGVFHVSLFRIAPTAFLGVVLAAVVIRSGSIYPAVLWHFLNNAVAVVPTRLGWVDASSRIPGWLYITATVALALSLLLVGEPRASKGRSPHKVTT